jgi:hypothetical protein
VYVLADTPQVGSNDDTPCKLGWLGQKKVIIGRQRPPPLPRDMLPLPLLLPKDRTAASSSPHGLPPPRPSSHSHHRRQQLRGLASARLLERWIHEWLCTAIRMDAEAKPLRRRRLWLSLGMRSGEGSEVAHPLPS